MPRKRGAPAPLPPVGGLPFKGRHGGRNAAFVAVTLATAGATVAYLQRDRPTLAPVLFVGTAWLCLFLWLAHKQGPAFASAAAIAVVVAGLMGAGIATTEQGRRPSKAASTQASAMIAGAGELAARCLATVTGPPGHKPGCLGIGRSTTPRRPR